MSRSKPLNVYVMAAPTGQHKIGISDNLTRRLDYLRADIGAPLIAIATYPREMGDARLVERAAHALLAQKRLKGEWFDVTADQAIEAVQTAIGMVEAGLVHAPKLRLQTPAIGVRLDPEIREALLRAAQADSRSLSSLVSKILAEWVAANPEQKKGKPRAR